MAAGREGRKGETKGGEERKNGRREERHVGEEGRDKGMTRKEGKQEMGKE